MADEIALLRRQAIAAMRQRDDEAIRHFLAEAMQPFEDDLAVQTRELAFQAREAAAIRELAEGMLSLQGANGKPAAPPDGARADTEADAPADAPAPAVLDLDAHISTLQTLGARRLVLLVLLEAAGPLALPTIRERLRILGCEEALPNISAELSRMKRPRGNGIPLVDHDELSELWTLNEEGKEVAQRAARRL